jgi:hypothetical protein
MRKRRLTVLVTLAMLVLTMVVGESIATEVLILETHQDTKHYWSLKIAGKTFQDLHTRAYGSMEDLRKFLAMFVSPGKECDFLLMRGDEILPFLLKQVRLPKNDEQVPHVLPGHVVVQLVSARGLLNVFEHTNSSSQGGSLPIGGQPPTPPTTPPTGPGSQGSKGEQPKIVDPGVHENRCELTGSFCLSMNGEASFSMSCEDGLGLEITSQGGIAISFSSKDGTVSLRVSAK